MPGTCLVPGIAYFWHYYYCTSLFKYFVVVVLASFFLCSLPSSHFLDVLHNRYVRDDSVCVRITVARAIYTIMIGEEER